MTPRQPRTRPVLTVTVGADHLRRLRLLVSRMPGGKASAVVDEMLGMCLPIFEEVVDAFEKARRPDGSVDEALAQDRVEAYLGAMMFKFIGGEYDTDALAEKGGGTTT